MRTVFVLFDSLNRRALECYGGTVKTPNFSRFSERAVTFDNHYVGSLPCMPARRELHTGRHNFLHRSWGPIEPFDVSMMDVLKENGTYTHLITDHYHYMEDGGLTYHNRFNSWELERGQEWDPCVALVQPPDEKFKKMYHPLQYDPPRAQGGRAQSMVNQEFVEAEEEYSLPRCFHRAFEFLDNNRDADEWVLQLECFDPHEPFYAPERFRREYPTGYDGPILNWPRYQKVEESPEEIAEVQANYSALVTMCDEYFGRLLDYFDAHDLWKDTALVVTTDHGYLLGEHDWWAKSRMPFYNEICHIPLLVYLPEYADQGGTRRQSLTQNVDLVPTFLEQHGAEIPQAVTGHSLRQILDRDDATRTAAIYGQFGAATNITDGRYTYFVYPKDIVNQQIYEYTLMPTHQNALFAQEEFEGTELVYEPFSFMQGFCVMKIPARPHPNRGQGSRIEDTDTVLYDLETDPSQSTPISAPDVEARLLGEMKRIFQQLEAPIEAYSRLGLDS